MRLDIIYEDEYMLACVKPYGVPSQGDKTNGEDMVSIVKNYLFDHSDSDEEPYVAVINRLDRPVGGVILFAKDENTAMKLSDMVQDRKIKKYYQAILRGEFPGDSWEGTFTDWILADKKNNLSKIVPEGTKGAKKAELSYEILDEFDTDQGSFTYVLIELHTGRHHQIRCQMAAHNLPILGDTKYGDDADKKKEKKNVVGSTKKQMPRRGKKPAKAKNEIALFSSILEFTHPITGEALRFHREPDGGPFDAIELDEEDF